MSLTSYRAAPPRVWGTLLEGRGEGRGPGGDLLFRRLSGSTIGAEGFHGRVRDGSGAWPLAMATRLVPVKAGTCPRNARLPVLARGKLGRPSGGPLSCERQCLQGAAAWLWAPG